MGPNSTRMWSILCQLSSGLAVMFPSEGWRRRRSPERRQPSLWRGVKRSSIVHVCGRAALIHGGATRGHCHRVGQAGVLAAAAPKDLGAHGCPILGPRGERGVVHRPQAGVLTVRRHGDDFRVNTHRL